jgi:hypothetical protein
MNKIFYLLEANDNGALKNKCRCDLHKKPGFKFLTDNLVEHTIFEEDNRKVIYTVVGRYINERRAREYKALRELVNASAVL